MKKIALSLFFLFHAFFILYCQSQDSTSFRRVQAWVYEGEPDSANASFENFKGVVLMRLKNNFMLLNASDSAIKVPRIDSQMDDVGTEIKINGEWVLLQGIDYSGIWCGNSYWNMDLPPGQFVRFSFYIPDEAEGQAVEIRLFARFNNKLIYTDTWMTHLYDWQIRQAGKPMP